ncbi:PaaI family thioesterase [Photobacterium alginatilyticum]|uniref:PaaI family thioesterase n=1 Tax=Photobacterium alginatilyticum TaxID=1775171 RepID=UPI004068AA11
MDSRVAQANEMLKSFSKQKVKLIDYCTPEILEISDEHLSLKIPLNDKTKNHLESMYFGALAIGADVAAGLLAMDMANHSGLNVSLAFKSVQGEFLRRPEDDVVFSCYQGKMISEMLERSHQTGKRINEPVSVTVTCPARDGNEPVATFSLTLSLKVVSSPAAVEVSS